jgi:Ca2+/Na+ antiporter
LTDDPNLLLYSAEFLALALGVVVVTRYLLLEGLENLCKAYGVSNKVHGQLLGYATSVPELVGTSATALRGLLSAGLWNVAASNMINVGLFIAAALYFRRGRSVLRKEFSGAIVFAAAAVAVPVVLLTLYPGPVSTPWAVAGLFLFFVLYLGVDRWLTTEQGVVLEPVASGTEEVSGPLALLRLLAGLVGIVVIGHYLGLVAEVLVKTPALNVPEYAVGWVLGVATSLPEMTTFFVVFAAARGEADGREVTQRSLDNLTASNMSNIGLIYPIAIILYLVAYAGLPV